MGSPDLFTGVNRGRGQTGKLKPMGTHKPSYHGLLLPQDRACWATLHGPRTERIPQLSQRPVTARVQDPSAGDLRRVALAAWLFQGN